MSSESASVLHLTVQWTPELAAIVRAATLEARRAEDRWLTLEQAARHARRSKATVTEWTHMGLATYHAGGSGASSRRLEAKTGRHCRARNEVLISRVELDAFIRSRKLVKLIKPSGEFLAA